MHKYISTQQGTDADRRSHSTRNLLYFLQTKCSYYTCSVC